MSALEEAVKGAWQWMDLRRVIRAGMKFTLSSPTIHLAEIRSELIRLEEKTKKLGWTKANQPISVICVDNKECYMHGTIGDSHKKWFNLAPNAPDESTLAFISCIASSVTETRDSSESVQIGRFSNDLSKALPVE